MPTAAEPNAPLIAGVFQSTWRGDCPGPVAMLSEACSGALADAGGSAAGIASIDALCVIRHVSAEHSDPAGLVADELGVEAGARLHTTIGGDTPQAAVGELAGRIADGSISTALICGGEALATLSGHLKAGTDPGWSDPHPEREPDEVLGSGREPNTAEETAAGLIAPLMIYPLFEHALWAEQGGSADSHRERVAGLWSRFSAVASTNPHAWTPGPFDTAEIATPSESNRLVSLPYTKLMNSNIQTDQAAAVLLCSHARADALGIPLDRRVYLHGSARATEPWFFSEREDLGRSPAIAGAVGSALSQAAAGVDDLALLDIYSCFPSAVQIAGREIGFDPFTDSREPTVTGGLSFAGGPGNAYVLQSIAAMVERLRELPGELGLVTAVGWYLTKHAAGVYGTRPPQTPFRRAAVHAEPQPGRRVAPVEWSGEAVGEAATVIYERDGSPSYGVVTAIAGDGRRVLRSSGDRAVLELLPDRPVTGRPVELPPDGGFRLG